MAFVHRKLWSFKPKQYGPWKIVHRSTLRNIETFYGINSDSLSLAMPMWGPGKQYDYARGNNVISTAYPSFNDSKITFAANDFLSVDKACLQSSDFSIIWRSRVDPANAGYFFCDSTDITNLFFRWNGNDQEGQIGALVGLSYTNAAFKDVIIDDALVLNGSTASFYVNKELRDDNTGYSFTGLTSNLYIANRPDLARDFLGDFHNFLIFEKALPSEKIALLHDNPWQLWQPVPKTTYFLPQVAGSSATLTGTAITGGVTESEIVTGGETIIITLAGDTWVATVGADNAITDALILGITSAQSETNGWNNVVRANMVFGDVARTSDTIVTITLAAEAAYSITSNETITITIPATALTAATEVVATPNIIVANESAGGMVKRLVDDGLLQGLTVGRLAA